MGFIMTTEINIRCETCNFLNEFSNGEKYCNHRENETILMDNKHCPLPLLVKKEEYEPIYGPKLNGKEKCKKCGVSFPMYVDKTKALHCGSCYFRKNLNEL